MSSGKNGSGKGDKRDVSAAVRAEQALRLRLLGETYQVIAQSCGYASRGGAYTAIQRELKRALREPSDDLRKMEIARLDLLWHAMAPKAVAGDTWSVDRCLAIMERRARLMGLDTQPSDAAAQANVRRVYERR